MRFFLVSKGLLYPNIRFLWQRLCSVAREQTDRHTQTQTHTHIHTHTHSHTQTKVNTKDTLSEVLKILTIFSTKKYLLHYRKSSRCHWFYYYLGNGNTNTMSAMYKKGRRHDVIEYLYIDVILEWRCDIMSVRFIDKTRYWADPWW